jgi:hypothetical protein
MVVDVDDAIALTASIGYPVVLKRDTGAAGDGVRICADQASLRRSFSELEAPERRARPHLRLARWMRGSYLRDCHHAAQRPLNVERFVRGPVATRAVVAWDGAILDGFSLLRDIVHPEPLGPSSLVHFIDHGDMEAATSRLITRWRASGFFGFDFIIDHDDHHAYLLECNPRPVPISHIGGFGGHDLCAALAVKLIGTTARPAEPVHAERVALFPQEWRRDPMSPWLHDAYHDVPWDDIPLLRALCGKSR